MNFIVYVNLVSVQLQLEFEVRECNSCCWNGIMQSTCSPYWTHLNMRSECIWVDCLILNSLKCINFTYYEYSWSEFSHCYSVDRVLFFFSGNVHEIRNKKHRKRFWFRFHRSFQRGNLFFLFFSSNLVLVLWTFDLKC